MSFLKHVQLTQLESAADFERDQSKFYTISYFLCHFLKSCGDHEGAFIKDIIDLSDPQFFQITKMENINPFLAHERGGFYTISFMNDSKNKWYRRVLNSNTIKGDLDL